MYNQTTNQLRSKGVIFLKYIYCFFLVLGFCSCAYQGITIGVVGDQFGSYDADESYRVMQKSVSKLVKYKPDVLLHVGDIVESNRDIKTFEDYQSNFEIATNIMNNTQIPWIVTIGDHDVVPPIYKASSSDRSREKWFMDCCELYKTPISDKPYYSKDVNGYHFISLYSLENLHTDPRWGSIFLNKINVDQLAWLKEDLKNNKDSNGIIVIVHHPHWYAWSNWMEVHEILREYPVITVIAGHYHYDQDDGTIDGIRYLVMGSSGGIVKDSDAHSGGVQEYAIIKIRNSEIKELNLYETDSDSSLEWTPRKSMDRVQAIAVMLDNLWKDVRLFRKDGKIFAKNNSSINSKKIELVSLANPIDVPIEIEIVFPDTILTDPIWNIADSTVVGYDPVMLDPGERIGWANYSNVGQWNQHPALWQAKFISSDKKIKQITLSVLVKFYDTQQRFIRRSITYTIN
ncbi:MAG: hypothetical protein GWP19_04425 [Planctomycetia bacterium]|nr:hypothetical protein [Planctomycetia bacterium]